MDYNELSLDIREFLSFSGGLGCDPELLSWDSVSLDDELLSLDSILLHDAKTFISLLCDVLDSPRRYHRSSSINCT
jgi:hypothetical protein